MNTNKIILNNKKAEGKPIFSSQEQIKKNSLTLFTYLTLISNLSDCHGYNRVRIFQQKNIILSQIQRDIGLDPKTIKKYWEFLEMDGLVQFIPDNYIEDYELPFNKRWTIRNKHKNSYYRIPQPTEFRVIPKRTLETLLNDCKVNELTYKVYISLVNYQEISILNNKQTWSFTYEDIRNILGLCSHTTNNKKIGVALSYLQSLGLVEVTTSTTKNSRGFEIPVFILKQANFFIHSEIIDFKPIDENVLTEQEIKEIRQCNHLEKVEPQFTEELQQVINQLISPLSSNFINSLIEKGYEQSIIAAAIKRFGIEKANKYSKEHNMEVGIKILAANQYQLLNNERIFQQMKQEEELKRQEEAKLEYQKIQQQNQNTVKKTIVEIPRKNQRKIIDLTKI